MAVETLLLQGYPRGDELNGLIVARFFATGRNVYIMRRYDPRFLLMLGKTQEWHGVEADAARQTLVEADLVLDKFLLSEEAKKFGLNEQTFNAAQQVLVYVKPFLNFNFGSDLDAFKAWKTLFLSALGHFESALSVDIEAQPIFLLERKLGRSVDVLLANIEEVLPEADRGVLSDFALDNMQESGACLAFHRFTASGFHMARAVEDVARRYNYAVTGHESPYLDRNGETRHRPLAQIAEELQDVLNNWRHPNDPRLLSMLVPILRNFCRIYRTPLSHADPQIKELDPNDAEVAFGHAVGAISSMLEDARAGGAHFKQSPVWR